MKQESSDRRPEGAERPFERVFDDYIKAAAEYAYHAKALESPADVARRVLKVIEEQLGETEKMVLAEKLEALLRQAHENSRPDIEEDSFPDELDA